MGGSGTAQRRHRNTPAAWAAACLFLGLLLGPALGSGDVASPTGVGLALSAAPASGGAPLDVTLRAALTPVGLTGTFNWSFGDGQSYESPVSTTATVTHEYPVPGEYVASVAVTTTSGAATSVVAIHVGPGTLVVALSDAPTGGAAPLSVQFRAVPGGGSGTYTAINWSFGDGNDGSGADLTYTYERAGSYTVRVTVTDSVGATASASATVVVSDAPPGASGGLLLGTTGTLAILGSVTALAVAAAALSLYRWRLQRARGPARERPMPPSAAPSPSEDGPTAPSPEAMAAADDDLPLVDASRRLSERILVHLYWYGRRPIDGPASPDATQAGMARRLGVAQNALSKSLRRLTDAGAVTVELRHVPGAPRRLKAYQLTPRGEAVARALKADPRRPVEP